MGAVTAMSYVTPEYYHRGARLQTRPTTLHGPDRPMLARGGIPHSAFQKAPSGTDPFPRGLHDRGLKKWQEPPVWKPVKEEVEREEVKMSQFMCPPKLPPRVVYKTQFVDSQEDAPRLKELGQLHMDNCRLESEIEHYQKQLAERVELAKIPLDYGLGPEFVKTKHLYKCLVEAPGVGYRNTPTFSDKVGDGCGPVSGDIVQVDRICQGPAAVFGRDTFGRGWVPLTHPGSGTRNKAGQGLFDPISLKEMEEQGLSLADGSQKLKEGGWFNRSPV